MKASGSEKDEFSPRQKAEIDALQREYELTVKSCEEQVKLLYGVPLVVAAILGITFKVTNISVSQMTALGLIGIYMLTLFWGKSISEIRKMKSHRIFLESQFNRCFGKEILIYGIRNKKIEVQETQRRKKNYTISSLVVFISVLLIITLAERFSLVIPLSGVLSLFVLIKLLRDSEKDAGDLWDS